MSKWQLKLMDLMTPAKTVQEEVDFMLDGSYKLRVSIQDDAVFIMKITGSTADHPERFPLSKLRKDQLDKIYEIMKKQQA
jgi:hypothetical protein